ncbi:hypothetical protein QBC32DRAFT_336848 [Pseudoneurospora amorphoporcata]|uniref:Smr domain-containing protein n=1 Tax=Pseudoneurospora amorphoporcata TaxID=241081 RepID=A0AAN6P1Y7_9PEZI|nr:hypothetical protein QBC32DRAFT_336848 [Pseudoneurospora amorphoporcata]
MAIPMERLGDRAFNHRTSVEIESEYDRLRAEARAEGDKMKRYYDEAHTAYERGDGAEAKNLSNLGKKHKAKRDALNKQAAEFIFRENNHTERVAADTIDLHGLYVEEAEDILEARIRDAQARGQTHLHVIVGKGHHSAGGVRKIAPRVEQVCREMGLNFAAEENEGRIYVDLTGGTVDGVPGLPQQPPGYQPGAGYQSEGRPNQYQGGGGYPGQHQHGGHHQQQQQQNNQQEDDIWGDLLGACFKKCCVVM